MIYYLCPFLLLDAVDFMETGKTFCLPSMQQECPRPKQIPVPITQDMDFYFNIVTVINFLTSLINAIIISICYKKHKDFLASILTVTMDTIQQKQQVQALRFSDDELSTVTVETTTVDSNATDYFQFSITMDNSYCLFVNTFTTCIILDNCITYCTTD